MVDFQKNLKTLLFFPPSRLQAVKKHLFRKPAPVLILLQRICFDCTARVSLVHGLQMRFCDILFCAREVVEALGCVLRACTGTLRAQRIVLFEWWAARGGMLVTVIGVWISVLCYCDRYDYHIDISTWGSEEIGFLDAALGACFFDSDIWVGWLFFFFFFYCFIFLLQEVFYLFVCVYSVFFFF